MDKYKALQAIKESDWRALLVKRLKEESETFMKRFLHDVDEDDYVKKFTPLHLVQVQIKTLDRLPTILDEMMSEEQPSITIDHTK